MMTRLSVIDIVESNSNLFLFPNEQLSLSKANRSDEEDQLLYYTYPSQMSPSWTIEGFHDISSKSKNDMSFSVIVRNKSTWKIN